MTKIMNQVVSSIILISTFSILSHAQDIPFTRETVTASSPADPWEKALADLDGDGKLDVIVGGPTGPVKWYKYPSWSETIIGGTNSYNSACGIAVGDIDNDGDMDVIMGGNYWFENPRPGGNPSTANWTRHLVGTHRSHDIVVGDLDKDGKLDVVSRNQESSGNIIYIFRQNSPTSFTQKTLTAQSGEGLALGDVDNDGYLDIIIHNKWYENPGTVSGTWSTYNIAPSFDPVAVVKVGDINKDGRLDVAMSASEAVGNVMWYECPVDPKTGTWTGHTVATGMNSVHGLGVADFNKDGNMDIVAAEFRTPGGLMVFRNQNGAGTSWASQTVGTDDVHNIQIGDIDNDGDIDIMGAYCWGTPPTYVYFNQSGPASLTLDDWTYVEVDNSRASTAFGLGMADGTGDGIADIASGNYFYRSPGCPLTGTWSRTTLPVTCDANFITNVDDDGFCDILAQALPNIYWLEANDAAGSAFTAHNVASGITATSHGSSQGMAMAQIIAGGKPEFVLSSGGGIYFVQIPADPSAGSWPVVNITSQSPEEGLACGDIDNDSDIDVAAWYGSGSGSNSLSWWENPGTGAGNWARHNIGSTLSQEGDRVEIADINKDGRKDVIVSETNNSTSGNAVLWFTCPSDPRTATSWTRNTIASNQGGMNSMDVADMDNDGDIDVITGEHRGSLIVKVWENVNNGASWTAHSVYTGKESHLGTQVTDMDNDGDMDILSVGWDTYQYLHLWRNNAITCGGSTPVCATPIISPNGGSHTGSVQVTLTCATPAAEIRYTTDDSDPTSSSTLYGSPFTLANTATVKAKAFRAGYTSSAVASAGFVITVDNTPPTISSVTASGDPTKVIVVFSEPVEQASAQNPGNYAMDNSISVSAAVLAGDNTTVTLAVTTLSGGTTYTLTVNNVRDRAAPPNTIAANTTNAFTYTSLPTDSLSLWLMADVGVATSGSAVVLWQDQSGNNRNAAQTVPASQPELINNAVNGIPVLRFDGSDDFLTFNLPVNGLTEMTMILVSSALSDGDGGSSGAGNAAIFWNETQPWGTLYLSPYQTNVKFRFGTTQASNLGSYTRPYSIANTFTVTTARKNNTTDELFVDGVGVSTLSSRLSAVAGCSDIGNLGRGYDDDTYWHGDIAEVLVYSRSLSNSERLAVEGYLTTKYMAPVSGMEREQGKRYTSIWWNPINRFIGVGFYLDRPTEVSLSVYNINGQLVRVLANEFYFRGKHQVLWDGADSHGKQAGAGVYLSKFRTDKYKSAKRIQLIQ